MTDAELVKALLLTRAGELKREREIAAQWDTIERDLRVPELWAFVTGRPSQEATHITLLLDTLAVWPKGRQRPAVPHLRDAPADDRERGAGHVGRGRRGLHSLIMGWYDNRDLFHKIGYLIARGRTFNELVPCRGTARSASSRPGLDAWIRADLSLKASDLPELRYGSTKTAAVLLLMNVETVRS